MTDPGSDGTVQRLRAEIFDVDRAILESVNARLELVATLKRHKEEHGLPFFDPDRERALLDALADANRGPLSEDGLCTLFRELLALTKREVSEAGGDAER